MATYHLRLRLPALQGQTRWGIWLPHQMSSYRLFIDGRLLTSAGRIGSTLEETVAGRRDAAAFFRATGKQTDVVLHIANRDFYNGGLRGRLVLGPESAIRSYVGRRNLIELVTLGLVLGAALYHFLFWLLHRKETAFLWFSLLALLLAMRIPFHMSKTHMLFMGEFSFAAQIRLLAVLSATIVPVGILLIRSLFPEMVSKRTVFWYMAIATIALGFQAGSVAFVQRANNVYIFVMLPAIVMHILYVLWRATRLRRAAVLMALGTGLLGVLGVFGFILNWRGFEGSYLGMFAILSFVIFQALALSRFFLGAFEARAALAERLRESRQALTRQREELQVNLHDSLGGALTDLQIQTERQIARADGATKPALDELRGRVAETVRMFRSQLLFMEDLEMTAQELLPGLQMSLLRRYADAGREIDFEFSDEAAGRLADPVALPTEAVFHIFFLAIELCTNDLKYGQGESFWRIGLENGDLCLLQKNGRRTGGPIPQPPGRASERVRMLRGRLELDALEQEYGITIWIPLP